jgi:hypothetical protein
VGPADTPQRELIEGSVCRVSAMIP